MYQITVVAVLREVREKEDTSLLKQSKQKVMVTLIRGWQGGLKELSGSERLLAYKSVRT